MAKKKKKAAARVESMDVQGDVHVIAASYEWNCPDCGTNNRDIETSPQVRCLSCRRLYNTATYEHATSSGVAQKQADKIPVSRETVGAIAFILIKVGEAQHRKDLTALDEIKKEMETVQAMIDDIAPDIAGYVVNGGGHCPYCKSEDIEANEIDFDDAGRMVQDVGCTACGRNWQDVYRLEGIVTEEGG